jgi:hypothetical protein
MIWIDFHGSTHGNFLEYVTNVWIMKTDPVSHSVFNTAGACHNFDKNYLTNRAIRCGHWWENNYAQQHSTHPMIRITIDKSDNRLFYIALVNRWYRAGDKSFDEWIADIPTDIRDSPVKMRNQYYYKYALRDMYVRGYDEFPSIPNPICEFKFSWFFVWSEFCAGLEDIAKFLNQAFVPDQALRELWQEFIDINQGYQSYNHCEKILENIRSAQPTPIDCKSYEEAWINYNINKTTGIENGPLFDNNSYPTDTYEIFNLIRSHV